MSWSIRRASAWPAARCQAHHFPVKKCIDIDFQEKIRSERAFVQCRLYHEKCRASNVASSLDRLAESRSWSGSTSKHARRRSRRLLRNISGMEVQMPASRLLSMPQILRVSLADGNPYMFPCVWTIRQFTHSTKFIGILTYCAGSDFVPFRCNC